MCNKISMSKQIFKGGRQFIALGLVLLVVLSPMVAVTPVGANTASSIPSDQTITVTENVSVWERSVLPLRTDTSAAATQIDNAAWYVSQPDIGTKELNKSTLGVFTKGTTIPLHFTRDDAAADLSTFANQDVHLVAARIDSTADGNTLNTESFTDALSLLNTSTETRLAQVNRNVSFTSVESESLNGEGNGKFTFTPSKSGEYVFFLAQGAEGSSGLSVDSEQNLSVTGDVTIVGVEHALVQDQASSVSLTDSNPARGETLEFTGVDSLSGDNVQHAILVYDETTGYEFQQFNLEVTGDPSNVSELANQTTFKHSISDIRGVARIDDSTTMFGPEENVSPSIGTLMDFIATNTDREIPETELIDGSGDSTLDASITAVSGNQETITVDTLTTWASPEEYRWVHIAVNDQGELRTDTGTFEMGKSWYGIQAASLNKNKVTVGDSVTATATVKNLGNSRVTREVRLKSRKVGESGWTVIDSKPVTLDGGATTSVSFTTQMAKAGDYEIAVNGKLAGTVTVTKQSGGGGGGGGGGGAIDPPSIVVTPKQQSDGSVVMDVRNGRLGTTVRMDVPEKQATCAPGVTFDRVNVRLAATNPHFTLRLNTSPERPATVTTDPAGVRLHCYLQVEKSLITNDEIGDATIRFSLTESQLGDTSPKNVALYRYHAGGWDELETTVVRKTGGKVIFKATTPGFSTFAIGSKQADISIENAELKRTTVTTGETVKTAVTLTNNGNGEGTSTLELTVNGEVVTTKKVTLASGETKTVTMQFTATSTGDHSVAVNGVSAGTLSVTDGDGTGDGDGNGDAETTTSGPGEEKKGSGIGGIFAIFIAIVVLFAAAGAAYYFLVME